MLISLGILCTQRRDARSCPPGALGPGESLYYWTTELTGMRARGEERPSSGTPSSWGLNKRL